MMVVLRYPLKIGNWLCRC